MAITRVRRLLRHRRGIPYRLQPLHVTLAKPFRNPNLSRQMVSAILYHGVQSFGVSLFLDVAWWYVLIPRVPVKIWTHRKAQMCGVAPPTTPYQSHACQSPHSGLIFLALNVTIPTPFKSSLHYPHLWSPVPNSNSIKTKAYVSGTARSLQ